MYKDSPDGQTYSCSHETKNSSGICDKCFGRGEYAPTKEDERILGILRMFYRGEISIESAVNLIQNKND